jgi:hypothetical protein
VYADVNGLKMFYEIRGTSDPVKVPVVLLHPVRAAAVAVSASACCRRRRTSSAVVFSSGSPV